MISGTPTATGTSSFTVKVTGGRAERHQGASQHHGELRDRDDLAEQSGAGHRGWRRSQRGGAGRQVPVRRRRLHHGSSLLQGATNTGTHVGNLWSSTGQKLGDGDLHGRDALGLAAGELRDAGGRSRPTPSTSRRTSRRTATTAATSTTSRPRAWTRRPLHALADGVVGRQRRVRLRRGEHLPGQHVPVAQLLGGRGLHDHRAVTEGGRARSGRARLRAAGRAARDRRCRRPGETRHAPRRPPSGTCPRAP